MIRAQLKGDTGIAAAICDCSAEEIAARGTDLVIDPCRKLARSGAVTASPMRVYRGRALPPRPARFRAPARLAPDHVKQVSQPERREVA
jgi:hypothetical protein